MVQIIAWRPPDDKLLSEPMMVRLPMHICVTQPQWIKHHIVFWFIQLYFSCIPRRREVRVKSQMFCCVIVYLHRYERGALSGHMHWALILICVLIFSAYKMSFQLNNWSHGELATLRVDRGEVVWHCAGRQKAYRSCTHLIHCVLVMPYGHINLGEGWL